MIKLLIFDLDGTLVNAYPAIIRSVNFTLESLGFPKQSNQTIIRAVGWGDRQLLAQFVGNKQADEAVKLYRPHHHKALKTGVRLLPGAKHVLTWAQKSGFKLAIASNRPTMFTEEILRGLKIAKTFDMVLCADKAKKGKPAPDMLWSICRKLKVKKDEALYVGDMTIDVRCGANAKIRTVAIPTGSSQKKELKELKPYKIIAKLNQLKELVNH